MKQNVIYWVGIKNNLFSEKYGKGTIDIDTGEFTPSN